MILSTLDWIIMGIFLSITMFIGIKFSKRAGKNLTEFFLSGRSLPWYIAGISMVATTFAADTPLAVTELVSNNGISGNWLWWNMLIGGMLTTFFFAKLWRRANILTEVEFIELRYSGKPASFLRGFKAIYLGLFMNVLIIGWVNLALISILKVFFNIPESEVYFYVLGAMLIIAFYSTLSGLWGVAINDLVQFFIAMAGSIILAIFVLNSDKIGGISGLKEKLDPSFFNFFPTISESDNISKIGQTFSIGIGTFLAYLGIQWWASWYPGAEPGGGGYVAQRMMSAKDEKNSIFATLLFQIAHYAIRPWPWIIVGLCTIVLYSLNTLPIEPELLEQIQALKADGLSKTEVIAGIPGLNIKILENTELAKAIVYTFDSKVGYVYAMRDFLPSGLKGLLLVAFLAAYMSTISTQLNWGASYLVNDVYKRFINKEDNNKKLIKVSRIITVLLSILAIAVTTQMTTISGVWKFIIECGAGLGLVLILRWYWWRINVWSEITATIVPFISYAILKFVFHLEFPVSFFYTVLFTTVTWLIVTFYTSPENNNTLEKFYIRIKPEGFWKPIRVALGLKKQKSQIGSLFVSWGSAVVMTYSVLFAMGKLIMMEWIPFLIYFGVFLLSVLILKWSMNKKELSD